MESEFRRWGLKKNHFQTRQSQILDPTLEIDRLKFVVWGMCCSKNQKRFGEWLQTLPGALLWWKVAGGCGVDLDVFRQFLKLTKSKACLVWETKNTYVSPEVVVWMKHHVRNPIKLPVCWDMEHPKLKRLWCCLDMCFMTPWHLPFLDSERWSRLAGLCWRLISDSSFAMIAPILTWVIRFHIAITHDSHICYWIVFFFLATFLFSIPDRCLNQLFLEILKGRFKLVYQVYQDIVQDGTFFLSMSWIHILFDRLNGTELGEVGSMTQRHPKKPYGTDRLWSFATGAAGHETTSKAKSRCVWLDGIWWDWISARSVEKVTWDLRFEHIFIWCLEKNDTTKLFDQDFHCFCWLWREQGNCWKMFIAQHKISTNVNEDGLQSTTLVIFVNDFVVM